MRLKYAFSIGCFHLIRISAKFDFKFYENSDIQKPGLPNCERINSVDQILSVLEHSRFLLPFLYTHQSLERLTSRLMARGHFSV